MPQYTKSEHSLPAVAPLHPIAEQPSSPSSLLSRIPINKSLTICQAEGIDRPSVTDTPEFDQASPPPLIYHFRRQHSPLSPPQAPLVESFDFSKPVASPMKVPHIETDDVIRVGPQSSQREAQEMAKMHQEQERRDKDAEIERNAERHTMRGGWMHRSRGSAELLQDRKFPNVGGD